MWQLFQAFAQLNGDLTPTKTSASFISNSDWKANIVNAYKTGKVVTVRIDANSLTASEAWIEVASGLPAASTSFFYQRYDSNSGGAYKIRVTPEGVLSLSNRALKAGVYIDDAITYVAQ